MVIVTVKEWVAPRVPSAGGVILISSALVGVAYHSEAATAITKKIGIAILDNLLRGVNNLGILLIVSII